MKITIQFDGGCRPTNPGNKYGSYLVLLDGSTVLLASRFELGFGTNNEAEFESLIKALEFTKTGLDEAGLCQSLYDVEMRTDSTILMNRINGKNKSRKSEPQQRMHALAERCLSLLKPYKSFTVQWQGRENNVAAFGH